MTLDFFGKDVLESLHGMCTFASSKKPLVTELFKDQKITNIHKFDNQSVFPSLNDDPDDTDMNQTFFEMAMRQYTLFFEKSLV